MYAFCARESVYVVNPKSMHHFFGYPISFKVDSLEFGVTVGVAEEEKMHVWIDILIPFNSFC